MNTCIKCGREIPDGELFCNDCALNPGASETVQKPAPALSGRMQKPVVHPPKPKPQPQPVQPTPPKRRTGHGVVIAILCVFTVLSLFLSIYLLANSASQRVSLRLRESDLEEREQHLTVLEQSLSDTQQELLDAKDELSQQAQTIEELQRSFSSAQSTVSQTQYDMTTQQAELERATQENKALQQENEALEQSVETLTATNEELASSNRLFLSKSKFMDSYVVFVENDGSGLYHKYGCDDFAQTSFWAYSRKLAEANGYKPCPRCFG